MVQPAVPTCTAPKSREVALSVRKGEGSPVPVQGRLAPPPPVQVTVSLESPPAVGEKPMETTWLCPEARDQVPPLITEKGGGTEAAPESVPPPALLTSKVRSLLEPSCTTPKSREVGAPGLIRRQTWVMPI